MSERRRRFCKCGCKRPLSGRQRLWASNACRMAFERGTATANTHGTRTTSRKRKPEVRFPFSKAHYAALEVGERVRMEAMRGHVVDMGGLFVLADRALDNQMTAHQRQSLQEQEAKT